MSGILFFIFASCHPLMEPSGVLKMVNSNTNLEFVKLKCVTYTQPIPLSSRICKCIISIGHGEVKYLKKYFENNLYLKNEYKPKRRR